MAKQSRGICAFCGKEMTKGGFTRHFPSCAKRKEVEANSREASGTVYHLVISDLYSPDFWLHLEIRDMAKLKDLDHYLRETWLECCGHLSMFRIDGKMYEGSPRSGSRLPIKNVFTPGMKVAYDYDFGSTTMLSIDVKSQREGKPLSKYPVYLMARNNKPEKQCMECENTAERLCIQCVYEDSTSGLLCATHLKEHPHSDYGRPHKLLNTPRVGVCGAITSDKPPY